jgi:hypothetical protein
MDLSIEEIQTLLAICVRGLHDRREREHHSALRDNLDRMANQIEDVYDELNVHTGP